MHTGNVEFNDLKKTWKDVSACIRFACWTDNENLKENGF